MSPESQNYIDNLEAVEVDEGWTSCLINYLTEELHPYSSLHNQLSLSGFHFEVDQGGAVTIYATPGKTREQFTELVDNIVAHNLSARVDINY